jgi:hypothetical protein
MLKVVVINDCANTTANLVPHLRNEFDVEMLLHSRGLWSKTAGLAYRIAKTHADLYHVNYALQDAWLAQKIRNLDVLWCHGSDVRTTQYSTYYGWIVRSNLKRAKCVLYANLDSPSHLKLRPDAQYMPIPVNTELFPLKSAYNESPKALYMPKKADIFNPNFSEICRKAGISLCILDRNYSYNDMPQLLQGFDIFVDTFSIAGNSTLGLEAMSTGLSVVDFHHWSALKERMEQLSEIEQVKREGRQNRQFVLANHDTRVVAEKLAKVWRQYV